VGFMYAEKELRKDTKVDYIIYALPKFVLLSVCSTMASLFAIVVPIQLKNATVAVVFFRFHLPVTNNRFQSLT
jgi:hypothetical protein